MVDNVTPGLPADRAGLRAGDLIVELGGWPMQSPMTRMARSIGTGPDAVQTAVIERGGRQFRLDVTSHGRQLTTFRGHDLELELVPVQLFSILLGLFIAARRPHDPAALLGGMLLCALGCLPLEVPRGMSVL